MPRPRRKPVEPDARRRWVLLRWFLIPLPEMPPETRGLAERYTTEVERLQSRELTDQQRCDALLAVLDDLEPGLRDAAEQHLERSGGGR
ncbi:MAG TPA: hypothetical protein VHF24_02805 [Acidimicrobiales bacterium]|nr:hypothetical protein [Acidimicrobiales bacterium]